MNKSQAKVVTRLPLSELWNEEGTHHALRLRDLTFEELRKLLNSGPVKFVIADIGSPFLWIPVSDCYDFWKSDVQKHLINGNASLEDFAGNYCYFASEWKIDGEPPIVVLPKSH